MLRSSPLADRPARRWAWFACAMVLATAMLASARVRAQAPEGGGPSSQPAPAVAEPAGETAPPPAPAPPAADDLNLFTLILSGGWFMVPIGIMSLLTLAFGIERGLGLRRARVLPEELVAALGQLAGSPGGFDPRKAYRICQEHPSTAATVIRAMLLNVGRPHSEVIHSVAETSEREAERLYANVRWLTLAAAVTPLLGLLGTVWGMIIAFHDTTQLVAGQNKADQLAAGIYTALVTTLGGLCVAIPAAIAAHWFEGRIQTLFHQIDELIFNLLPQIERYEGRVRFSRPTAEGDSSPPEPVGGARAEAVSSPK